jgi:hypothetical protein
MLTHMHPHRQPFSRFKSNRRLYFCLCYLVLHAAAAVCVCVRPTCWLWRAQFITANADWLAAVAAVHSTLVLTVTPAFLSVQPSTCLHCACRELVYPKQQCYYAKIICNCHSLPQCSTHMHAMLSTASAQTHTLPVTPNVHCRAHAHAQHHLKHNQSRTKATPKAIQRSQLSRRASLPRGRHVTMALRISTPSGACLAGLAAALPALPCMRHTLHIATSQQHGAVDIAKSNPYTNARITSRTAKAVKACTFNYPHTSHTPSHRIFQSLQTLPENLY